MATRQKRQNAVLLALASLTVVCSVLTGCNKGTTTAPSAAGVSGVSSNSNASNIMKQQAAQQQQMAQRAQQMQHQSHPVTQPLGQTSH